MRMLRHRCYYAGMSENARVRIGSWPSLINRGIFCIPPLSEQYFLYLQLKFLYFVIIYIILFKIILHLYLSNSFMVIIGTYGRKNVLYYI